MPLSVIPLQQEAHRPSSAARTQHSGVPFTARNTSMSPRSTVIRHRFQHMHQFSQRAARGVVAEQVHQHAAHAFLRQVPPSLQRADGPPIDSTTGMFISAGPTFRHNRVT